MADISMCGGEHCPIKNKCYRYTAKPNPNWQSVVEYIYDTETKSCKGFLSNKGYK